MKTKNYFQLLLTGRGSGFGCRYLADGNFDEIREKMAQLFDESYNDDYYNDDDDDNHCNIESYTENEIEKMDMQEFYNELWHDIDIINDLFVVGKIVFRWWKGQEIYIEIEAF